MCTANIMQHSRWFTTIQINNDNNECDTCSVQTVENAQKWIEEFYPECSTITVIIVSRQ